MPKSQSRRRSLVIVHLSSLDSFTAEAIDALGAREGVRFAESLAESIECYARVAPSVLVLDQNWEDQGTVSAPRRALRRALVDMGARFLYHDEDAMRDPWGDGMKAAISQIKKMGNIDVGGFWCSERGEGCVHAALKLFRHAGVNARLLEGACGFEGAVWDIAEANPRPIPLPEPETTRAIEATRAELWKALRGSKGKVMPFAHVPWHSMRVKNAAGTSLDVVIRILFLPSSMTDSDLGLYQNAFARMSYYPKPNADVMIHLNAGMPLAEMRRQFRRKGFAENLARVIRHEMTHVMDPETLFMAKQWEERTREMTVADVQREAEARRYQSAEEHANSPTEVKSAQTEVTYDAFDVLFNQERPPKIGMSLLEFLLSRSSSWRRRSPLLNERNARRVVLAVDRALRDKNIDTSTRV